MSNFEVKIQKIYISTHKGADKLEIGNIGSPSGWQVVVGKDLYITGDLVAYIGENAVVPEWVLKKYGYWNEEKNKGMLAGSKGTRVKAVRLRDEFSLGICIPVYCEEAEGGINYYIVIDDEQGIEHYMDVHEGEDVSELLGVIKYEAPIPVQMAGEVYNMGLDIGVNFDIENIKNFPDVLQEGEEVVVTEKIHGTFCQVVVIPFVSDYYHIEHLPIEKTTDNDVRGYIAVSSKGLGGNGLFLKHNEKNEKNVYLRTTKPYYETLVTMCDDQYYDIMTVCGEVYGDGVQDLKYGLSRGQTDFRVFDVYIGPRGKGYWLNDSQLDKWCEITGILRVPVLYRGPYSEKKLIEITQHTKSIFDAKQVNEGGVVCTTTERYVHGLGRVKLKMVNEDYYTRKGNITEFN
jgi:RNA ligase (TIGR02306 family)